MICPYCHNEINEVEYCPICKVSNPPSLIGMEFFFGEGPMGTWECPQCKKGFRTTPFGLFEVSDLVGRYASKQFKK